MTTTELTRAIDAEQRTRLAATKVVHETIKRLGISDGTLMACMIVAELRASGFEIKPSEARS